MNVPFAVIGADGPISPLCVLDHQGFGRRVKLFSRDASRRELASKAKIFVFNPFEWIGICHCFPFQIILPKVLFGSLAHVLDRVDDFVIAGAATQISADGLFDI